MVSGRARFSLCAKSRVFASPKSMMEKAMSALTQSQRGEASTFLGSLVTWLAAIATRYARAVSRRRALAELARLDDRMLKDIGLYRADIAAAESLPLGRDSIAHLTARRAEQNNARCARRCD
jgi:uncharacterized protein YjiS (DUF1127 family)